MASKTLPRIASSQQVVRHLSYPQRTIRQTNTPKAMELQDLCIHDDSVTLEFENIELDLLRDDVIDRAVFEYLTGGTFKLTLTGNLWDEIVVS